MAEAKRSNSVPLNLSEDAQEFMEIVVEQSSIPEDQELSPYHLADSIRSESDYFYCPIDDSVELTSETRNDTSTKQQVSKLVEHQQHRQAAIAKLEEFFLGESSSSTKASSVSVMDLPSPAPSPKRNIFGEIIEENFFLPAAVTSTHQHQRTQSADSPGFFLDPGADEDHSTFSSKKSESATFRAFTRLQAGDRAHSLPLECMSRTCYGGDGNPALVPTLTKKPSLKKISSIGQSLSSKKTNSEGSLHRTVSFSSLSIREYPPAISDNPSCSFGPPVQLDWDYEAEETHRIDHYEESRQPRRASHDLLLSYYDRRFLLLKQAGYSRKEVKEAMKEAERVKRERMVTDLFLPAQALDETMETVVDTVKRFFSKSEQSHTV